MESRTYFKEAERTCVFEVRTKIYISGPVNRSLQIDWESFSTKSLLGISSVEAKQKEDMHRMQLRNKETPSPLRITKNNTLYYLILNILKLTKNHYSNFLKSFCARSKSSASSGIDFKI